MTGELGMALSDGTTQAATPRIVWKSVALAALVLVLRAMPAVAGCCEFPGGCLDSNDPPGCELEGGTFHPDPSMCEVGADPPSCTAGEPPWPGFTDGRLNPDPGEYYSVWCSFDRVDVYRAVPTVELLKLIPIVDLINLPVGASLDLGDFMSAVRTGEDTLTIFGSNGNLAPESGSKAFGVDACIVANGGAPEPVTEDPPPSGPEGEEPVGPSESELCFDIYAFDDAELLIECLEFEAQQAGTTSLEICWLPVFRFRFGLSPGFATASRPAASGADTRTTGLSGAATDDESFLFLALYLQLTRLRDGVFAQTPGGRRATQLYYEHSSALLDAAIQNPAVLTTGRDALESWAPIVDALVSENTDAGVGTTASAGTTTASAAQVQAFQDFLDAVRAGGSPELLVALERAVERVDPASFLGLTPAELLARLERLGCDAAADFASLRCRLEELADFVDANVELPLRKKFAKPIARALKQLTRAEAAEKEKRRYKSLRRVLRLLGKVEKRLEKRKVVERIPEPVRSSVSAQTSGLSADVETLIP